MEQKKISIEYWPDQMQETRSYGPANVSLLSMAQRDNVTHRTFEVSSQNKGSAVSAL